MADASEASAEDVFEAIHGVMHLYRATQHRAQRAGASDLTPMDGRVLGFFMRHPGGTPSDLALHSGRDKGQLARLIGGLRERGLLAARDDDGDRRVLRLEPTAAGRAAQQALRRQARRVAERGVAGLAPDERRTLVELLRKVAAGLAPTDE